MYCLPQPLANKTRDLLKARSSKPRFPHRGFPVILKEVTTRRVCRPPQAVSYGLKDTGESGFCSWQGRDSFSSPWPPDQLWPLLASWPIRIKRVFLGVKLMGLEADHTSSSMETSYFRLDHVLLWDLVKYLHLITYQLHTYLLTYLLHGAESFLNS